VSDRPTRDDVARWLGLTVEPDAVVELRILGAVDDPKYPPFTLSGYYDHAHLVALADAASKWTGRAEGCYITINPVRPDLLARASNRVVRRPRHTTTDAEIARRVGLVFDADPMRPAGVSATEEEKAGAWALIDRLKAMLTRRGWPEPVVADSGNGFHLRYRIDLPADDGGLVGRVLEAAASLVSGDLARIDTSLSNPGRIIKLYGSMARKGDHTDDRPHRWSRILEVPSDFRVVPTELLEAFAAEHQPAPPPETGDRRSRDSGIRRTDRDGPEARHYAAAALERECQAVATATPGERNNVLNRAAYAAGTLVDALDEQTAWLNLRAAARRCGLPDAEAIRTIRSGLAAGQMQPRDLSDLAAARPAGSGRNGPPAGIVALSADPPIVLPEWPAPPDPFAYTGLPGEIVRTIEPESEADPVALLVQLLVAFGNAVGRRPHVRVGAAQHFANEFVVLVGETSAGRKGTSWHDARRAVADADPEWAGTRIQGGLSSGEGLIYHVRDPIEGKEPLKDKGKVIGYQDVVRDHGVADKRLLVFESEFGGVLKALGREGNKLRAVIRQAWDGDLLASLTKGEPFRATGAHVSVVAHITVDELTRLLSECDQANGLANRFLWACCKRSKLLPFGGRLGRQDADRLQAGVVAAIAFARGVDEVTWSREAMALWQDAYPELTAPRPGAYGRVTSRAEAHSVRLATLYALMGRSSRIEPPHLKAALALWDYCERSARYIFGDALGDKDAQVILDALRAAPEGLTRHQIRRDVFNGHRTGAETASKLALLLRRGLVRSETVATDGRPAERWFAVAPCAISAISAGSPASPDPLGANGASGAGSSDYGPAPGRDDIEVEAVEPDPATAASTKFEEGDI
jgi:hypothetical protein